VLRDGKASPSFLQRRFHIGWNRAYSLIEQMEQEGIVSPPSRTGKRTVIGSPKADRDARHEQALAVRRSGPSAALAKLIEAVRAE
jgi:DNA segregation ATPase FtsK/SpoIIIE-like protein